MKMDKLLKQAKILQEQMDKMQKELSQKIIIGEAGGGMVKIEMNGNGEALSVSISPEVVNSDDIEMLEDLVLAALKDAILKKEDISNKNINSISQNFGDLPNWI
ncbi:MAG: YbaB/EbfC family nucleoid-associated protein [Synergistaceae bacterium]|jgi:DNA-binding YbaB/EbfC family protein|nr:YbaB/EbfC family nucleoid-associated protein [Synergistaceae bacterium]